MAEPTQFSFSYKELVTMLVRAAGVTEGEWGIQVQLGLQAANIGPTDNDLVPAAIVAITHIGLQKVEKPTNLSVNASEIALQGKKDPTK